MPLLLFLTVCIEVAALIKLGQSIGAGFVLLELAATAALGVLLLRAGGRRLARTQQLVALLIQPSGLIRQSTAFLSAGLLLIVPGLLTDLLAVGLLVRHLFRRGSGPQRSTTARQGSRDVIDVDYRVHEDRDP